MAAQLQRSSGASSATPRPGASVHDAINISDDGSSSDYCSEDEAEARQGVDGIISASTITSDPSSRAVLQGHGSPMAISENDVLFAEPLLPTEKSRIPLDASVSEGILRGVAPTDQQGLAGLGISFPSAPKVATTPTSDVSDGNKSGLSIVTSSFGCASHAVPQDTDISIAYGMSDVLCSEGLSAASAHALSLKGSAVERLLRATAPDDQTGSRRITVFSATAGPSPPSAPVNPTSITPSTLALSNSGGNNTSSAIKKQNSGNPGLGNTILFSPRRMPGSSQLRNGVLSAPRRSGSVTSSTRPSSQSKFRNGAVSSPTINAPSSAVREDANATRAPKRQRVAPPSDSSSGLVFNFGSNPDIAPSDKPNAARRAGATPIEPKTINRAILKRKAGASPPYSSSSVSTKSVKVPRPANPTLPTRKSEQNTQNKKFLSSLGPGSADNSPLAAQGPIKSVPKKQKRSATTRAGAFNRPALGQFNRAFDVSEDSTGGFSEGSVSSALPDSTFRAGHNEASRKAGVDTSTRQVAPERRIIKDDSASSLSSSVTQSAKDLWGRRMLPPATTVTEYPRSMLSKGRNPQPDGQHSASSTNGHDAIGSSVDTPSIQTSAQFEGSRDQTGKQPSSGFVTPEMIEESEEYESEPDTSMSPTMVREMSDQVASSQRYWRRLGENYAPFGSANQHNIRNETDTSQYTFLASLNGGVGLRPRLGSPINLIGELSVSRKFNPLLDTSNAGEPSEEEDSVEEDQIDAAGDEIAAGDDVDNTADNQPYIAEAAYIDIAGLSKETMEIMGIVAPEPENSKPVASKQSTRPSQSTNSIQSTKLGQSARAEQQPDITQQQIKRKQQQQAEFKQRVKAEERLELKQKQPVKSKHSVELKQPAERKLQLTFAVDDPQKSKRDHAAQLAAYARAKQDTLALDHVEQSDLSSEAIDEGESDNEDEQGSEDDGKDKYEDDSENKNTFSPLLPITAHHTTPPPPILKPTTTKRVHFLKFDYLIYRTLEGLQRYNDKKISGPVLSMSFSLVHASISSAFMTPDKLREALRHVRGLLGLLLRALRGFVSAAKVEGDAGVREVRLGMYEEQVGLARNSVEFVDRRIMDCERLMPGA